MRDGDNADMGVADAADAGGVRSDTMMLINIPASRKRVVPCHFRAIFAASAATELRAHGFRVLAPEDYPSSLSPTTALFASGNEQGQSAEPAGDGNGRRRTGRSQAGL